MAATTTSEEIIQYLFKQGHNLTTEQVVFIRETIYTALSDAYIAPSNGCDCGQMSCVTCHG